ncbi:MAG: hypothetical protein CMH55_08750 [Myxococcales bacterium]|nr:hypothetical protein [Myxococcales bacterium]
MITARYLIDRLEQDKGPITAGHLLSSGSYERHRKKLLDWAQGLRSERRISLGPDFTLLFENRATVWMQIQEELRWVQTPPSPSCLGELLSEYNRLISFPGEPRGCLFMDSSDGFRTKQYLTKSSIAELGIQLHLNGRSYRAVAMKGGKHLIEPVTYIRFAYQGPHLRGQNQLEWCLPVPERKGLPSGLTQSLLKPTWPKQSPQAAA